MPAKPGRKPMNPARDPGNSPAAKPANDKLKLRVAQLSDVGRARDHQEDTVGVFVPSDPALLARKGQLLIIADGMGGHNAGEVASQAAVSETQRAYFATAADDIAANLRQALTQANQAIRQTSLGDAGRQGMGTTAAVAVVRDREVHIANIGDSRVYLLRGGAITQVTQDHSWVEEQVRAGVLTLEQARAHPQRNVITRALGTTATIEPDLFNGVLQEGDVLLLCSDGLSNMVSSAEMLEIAGQAAPEQAARRLVDLANERGGSDNISVILARAETPESAVVRRPPPAARRMPVALLGLAALLLVGMGVGAVLLIRSRTDAAATATPVALTSPSGGVAATTPLATSAVTAGAVTETATATITATLQAAQSPTATLIPTATQTATALPAPTATRTRVGAVTAPAPVVGTLPAPQLLKPIIGFTATEDLREEFSWQWTGTQSSGYVFQIFMRKLGNLTWEKILAPVAIGSDGSGRQVVTVSDLEVTRRDGAGVYEWTVAVVNSAGKVLSNYAPLRTLVYRPGSGPAPAAPQPATPIKPPIDTPEPTNTPEPTEIPTLAPTPLP